MPPSKPKPSEIAAEAKKIYIPHIKQKYPQWDTTSYLIADSAAQMRCQPPATPLRCRIGMCILARLIITYVVSHSMLAMIEGDPVDVALSWAATNDKEGEIPIISMANDKRPGGDWEASS
jgi:hypothetical protein